MRAAFNEYLDRWSEPVAQIEENDQRSFSQNFCLRANVQLELP
jgi:hypothetical protein